MCVWSSFYKLIDYICFKINVEMERFFDPDIPNFEEAVEIMDHYEWTLTDNSHHGNIIFKWSQITIDKNNSNTVSYFLANIEYVVFMMLLRFQYNTLYPENI